MRRCAAAMLLCGVAALAMPLLAAGRPLPAFDLVSASGAAVPSSRFATADRWLVVSVAPECGSCDRLLAALAERRATVAADRIAIVIAGDLNAARHYADQRAIAASGFAWYADASGAAARALGAQRVPALAGIGGGELAWSIGGVLNQPSAIERAIRGWIAQ
jgi:hypothetical protein